MQTELVRAKMKEWATDFLSKDEPVTPERLTRLALKIYDKKNWDDIHAIEGNLNPSQEVKEKAKAAWDKEDKTFDEYIKLAVDVLEEVEED